MPMTKAMAKPSKEHFDPDSTIARDVDHHDTWTRRAKRFPAEVLPTTDRRPLDERIGLFPYDKPYIDPAETPKPAELRRLAACALVMAVRNEWLTGCPAGADRKKVRTHADNLGHKIADALGIDP